MDPMPTPAQPQSSRPSELAGSPDTPLEPGAPRPVDAARALEEAPAPPRLLVVEDEPGIAAHLVRGLRARGYAVSLLVEGTGVAEAVRAEAPDGVVLDVMLPGLDGLSALRALRRFSEVPVVVLTAKDALDDRLQAFAAGATDFLSKPYFLEELVARLDLRIGRRRARPHTVVRFADAALDLDAHRLEVGGQPVGLTRHELDILAYLVRRPGRAVARGTLVTETFSGHEERSERIVDVHISRLRAKLGEAAAARVVTVRGLGYRFDPDAPDGRR